jgi:glycosidase
MIIDMVFNHCGISHWWMDDLPYEDWIHQHEEFTRSNFRSETIMDPYASDFDKRKMNQGWFVESMPDLNQHNPFMARYLIQNSIWWIETIGVDGIRMDTYPYSYQDFMKQWVHHVILEYPNFNIVGETWLQKEAHTAFFLEDDMSRFGENSELPAVTDFPLHYALENAFKEENSWTNGVARFYYVLSQDYLYSDAYNTLIFADNHDLDRYFSSVKEDLDSWKMGMALLLTTRGIPMIYYGTEILMTGFEHEGHGHIREDFPGGWEGDSINVFKTKGRNQQEKDAHKYLASLLKWRKESKVIHQGKLMQFVPENGIYVYFRYDETETVMVVLNNNPNDMTLDLERFEERIEGFDRGKDILSGEKFKMAESIELNPKSARIIELF